jgi:HSP20 family protein
MTLIRDLLQLQQELDRTLQRPTAFLREPSGSGVFPPVNVFRGAHGLSIRAELPGVAPGDLSVTTEGRQLTIAGERRAQEDAARGGYHRRERAWGRFSRTLHLPDDLDTSKVEASLRHGVLTIDVERREEAKPRQVAVTTT